MFLAFLYIHGSRYTPRRVLQFSMPVFGVRRITHEKFAPASFSHISVLNQPSSSMERKFSALKKDKNKQRHTCDSTGYCQLPTLISVEEGSIWSCLFLISLNEQIDSSGIQVFQDSSHKYLQFTK